MLTIASPEPADWRSQRSSERAQTANVNIGQEKDHGDLDTTQQRSTLWKWASSIIVVAGVGWVVFLLSRDFDSLSANFRVENVSWLIYTFVAGVAALLLTVPVFQTLLSVHGNLSVQYGYAARMLFVAQILRHLPGRVWGIMYLVVETRSAIPSAAMVRANLDGILYSIYFNTIVAAFLYIAVLVAPLYAVIFAVLGLSGLAFAIRRDWLGRFAGVAARLVPRRAARFAEALSVHRIMPWSAVATIIASYTLSWACYLSIWWAFTRIFPVLVDINIWLLCASYSVAWVVGYVTMITPAGLGVREASFFALASSLMALPNLAFIAVFVRLWQIVTEFLAFLIFAFVKPAVEADNSAATTNSG